MGPASRRYWTDADDKASLQIERGEWKSYRIHYVHPIETGDLTGYLTAIGDERYLDVMPSRGEDRGSFLIPVHAVLHLRLEGDRLELTPLSYELVQRTVAYTGRAIPGLNVAFDQKENALLVTPAERFREWLRVRSVDGPVFGASATFVRGGPAKNRPLAFRELTKITDSTRRHEVCEDDTKKTACWHAGLGRRRVEERGGPGESAALSSTAFSPGPSLSSTHRASRGASISLAPDQPGCLRVVFLDFVSSMLTVVSSSRSSPVRASPRGGLPLTWVRREAVIRPVLAFYPSTRAARGPLRLSSLQPNTVSGGTLFVAVRSSATLHEPYAPRA